MSINHRGTHIRMPQQFLHRSDIRPGLEQMSRETVAKRVATDLLVNLRTQHSSADKFLHGILVHMMPALGS